MKIRTNAALAALALGTLVLAPACTQVEDETPETATKDDGTLTLAAALGAEEEMKTLNTALADSELSGVLDGSASYTLLAPNDKAFDALGEEGKQLMAEEQRPVLIGILRDHMLPGHLTPEAIDKAIETKGGPVTMTTLGDGEVSFSKDGDKIFATGSGGTKAEFVGTAIAANNGVVIPVSTVLLPPKEG